MCQSFSAILWVSELVAVLCCFIYMILKCSVRSKISPNFVSERSGRVPASVSSGICRWWHALHSAVCACLGQCFVVADMLSQFTRLYSGEVLISVQHDKNDCLLLTRSWTTLKKKTSTVVCLCCMLAVSVVQFGSQICCFSTKGLRNLREIFAQGQNFKNEVVQCAIQVVFSFFLIFNFLGFIQDT